MLGIRREVAAVRRYPGIWICCTVPVFPSSQVTLLSMDHVKQIKVGTHTGVIEGCVAFVGSEALESRQCLRRKGLCSSCIVYEATSAMAGSEPPSPRGD